MINEICQECEKILSFYQYETIGKGNQISVSITPHTYNIVASNDVKVNFQGNEMLIVGMENTILNF